MCVFMVYLTTSVGSTLTNIYMRRRTAQFEWYDREQWIEGL